MPPDLTQYHTYAVDFETSYTKDRDLKTLGVVPYVEHPDTDIYLVSIVGPCISYCGSPADAPWGLIDGQHWVSHNAGFDIAAFLALRKVAGGALDDIAPVAWDCTANLCAFLALPRSLRGAVEQLYAVLLDKGTRDAMRGQTWETMTPEFQEEARCYALADSEWCLRIWNDHSHKWPWQEVAISRHTTQMCLNGVQIDVARIEGYLATLNRSLWLCEQSIPWVGELDVRGKPLPVNSRTALFAACEKAGIPPPASTADKNPSYELWLDTYGPAAPFVDAVKNHRRLNRVIELLKKMRDQTGADGRLRYSLMYYGAHTGRWSGSGGINFQNFPRDPLGFDAEGGLLPKDADLKKAAMTVDIRSVIIPAPGKKFIIADQAQIEARVTLWFAEDYEQLGMLNTMDVYEAHARRTMGYTDPRPLKDYVAAPDCPEKDRKLRQIAKARRLGLGFGMGHVRLIEYAKAQLGLDLDALTAKRIVNDFRRSEPGVKAKWDFLMASIRRHAAKRDPEPFGIELPSWRTLEYFDISASDDSIKARDERGGLVKHWHGGKLFENLVQATARDTLVESILRLEDAGYPVVLHVHDEVICEVDMDVPEETVRSLMRVTPDWAPLLPIDSSVATSDRYLK